MRAPGAGEHGAVFGPTIAFVYRSATTETDFPVFAWGVAFGADGS